MMIADADASLVLWDCFSPGTANTITHTLLAGKPLYVATSVRLPKSIPETLQLRGTTGKRAPQSHTDLIVSLAQSMDRVASNISFQYFNVPVGKLSITGAEWLISLIAAAKGKLCLTGNS